MYELFTLDPGEHSLLDTFSITKDNKKKILQNAKWVSKLLPERDIALVKENYMAKIEFIVTGKSLSSKRVKCLQ